MAQSKSFFGKRRGSTKNFTFTVFNGKQVTKEKAEQVKNPRTLAQMRNRMILTTSSAAYAAMKEIVDHSFQGYTYGLQNMSRFQSVNNKLLRENLTAATSQFAYAEYGKAKLLPGAYQISEGSLSPLPLNVSSVISDDALGPIWNVALSAVGSPVTANGLLSALNLAVGELATMCVIAPLSGSLGYTFVFVRVCVTRDSDVVLTNQNVADYLTIESNYPVSFAFSENTSIQFKTTVENYDVNGVLAYAFIHSALVNGTWQRSQDTMALRNANQLAPTATSAIATYPIGGSYILNNGDVPNAYEVVNGDPVEP